MFQIKNGIKYVVLLFKGILLFIFDGVCCDVAATQLRELWYGNYIQGLIRFPTFKYVDVRYDAVE